jgi:putative transposase
MLYNPKKYYRRSIRLKGYDYAQEGAYFITMCCKDRRCLFGDVVESEMIVNDAGRMIEMQWQALTNRFTHIHLHEFIIMPNHFHAILQIRNIDEAHVGAPLVGALPVDVPKIGDESEIGQPKNTGQPQGIAPTMVPNKTVGDMVDAFKSITTVAYIRGIKNSGWIPFDGKLWQRNYFEHIIRNEESYQTIASYIVNNPSKWKDDRFFNPIIS